MNGATYVCICLDRYCRQLWCCRMSDAESLSRSPVRRLIRFLPTIAPVFAMLSALFTGGASLLSLGAWTLFRANEAAIWAAVRSGIGIEQIAQVAGQPSSLGEATLGLCSGSFPDGKIFPPCQR